MSLRGPLVGSKLLNTDHFDYLLDLANHTICVVLLITTSTQNGGNSTLPSHKKNSVIHKPWGNITERPGRTMSTPS